MSNIINTISFVPYEGSMPYSLKGVSEEMERLVYTSLAYRMFKENGFYPFIYKRGDKVCIENKKFAESSGAYYSVDSVYSVDCTGTNIFKTLHVHNTLGCINGNYNGPPFIGAQSIILDNTTSSLGALFNTLNFTIESVTQKMYFYGFDFSGVQISRFVSRATNLVHCNGFHNIDTSFKIISELLTGDSLECIYMELKDVSDGTSTPILVLPLCYYDGGTYMKNIVESKGWALYFWDIEQDLYYDTHGNEVPNPNV